MNIPFEVITPAAYDSLQKDRAELKDLYDNKAYQLILRMSQDPDFPNLPGFISLGTFIGFPDRAPSCESSVALELRLRGAMGNSALILSSNFNLDDLTLAPDATNQLGFRSEEAGSLDILEIYQDSQAINEWMIAIALEGYLLNLSDSRIVRNPVRRLRVASWELPLPHRLEDPIAA